MKKTLLFAAALLATSPVFAQVQNCCLRLSAGGSVDCGPMPELNGLESFTLQFWMNADEWTEGATLMSRGDDLRLSLGEANTLVLTFNGKSYSITRNALKEKTWIPIMVVGKGQRIAVYVNKTIAKNVVAYREKNGAFKTRKELLKVPKLGPKAYEQCAGFLRIPGGKEALDNTSVHPESYEVAKKLLASLGHTDEDLKAGGIPTIEKEVGSIEKEAEALGVGVPTLTDIISELKKPGRDPREDMPKPILRSDVLSIEDLKPGMVLKGTRTNVVNNQLAVICPVNQATKVEGLSTIGNASSIALADGSVPVGKYTRVAMIDLGLLQPADDPAAITTADISEQLGGVEISEQGNVSKVLTAVEEGSCEVGTTYVSDTVGHENSVRIIETVSNDVSGDIIYPVAGIANKDASDAETAAAADFIAFITNDDAKKIYQQYGFDTDVE